VEVALRDPNLGVRLVGLSALQRRPDAWSRWRLRCLARGDDPYLALHAGQALVRLQGDERPLLAAIDRASRHRLWPVRAAAVNAAAMLDRPAARALLRPVLRDPQPAVRLAAATVLVHHEREASLRVARSVLALGCRPGGHRGLCLQAAGLLALAR
jgi:HEAT repeat protein